MTPTKLQSPSPRACASLPATVAYPIIARTFLPRPTEPLTKSLGDVLDGRQSRRTFKALPTERLAALLWYAARTRGTFVEQSGFVWQHRAAPSAGGRHPVDILVSAWSPQQQALHLYDPLAHALCTLDIFPSTLANFTAAVDAVLPIQEATICWFAAQWERTTSKYEHGESLIWRDAGALLATVSFVAEALSLHCCAVGLTGDPWISLLLPEGEKLMGVGGCLIGCSPSSD